MFEISVYKNSSDYAKKVRCFCERVNLVGVDVPYSELTNSARFIYGQQCIIEFVLL